MKYKAFLNQTKDEVISQLQKANDASVQESREVEIRRLELQERLISEIPKLRDQILLAFEGIEQRLTAVPDSVPVTSGVAQKKVTNALKELGVIDVEYVDVDEIRGIDRTASYSSLPPKGGEEESTQSNNVFLQLLPGSETHSEPERSEEHTSELQSHSFISYAVFCLKE